MRMVGKIVVIRKNGTDGNYFPLTESCLFGRSKECDVRIQLPEVSKEHCRIVINQEGEIVLTNISQVNPTLVNNKPITQPRKLSHHDIVTVVHRSFRIEYTQNSPGCSPTMSDSAVSGTQLRTPLKPKLDQNNDQIVDADTPKSALKPGAGSQRSSISSSRRSVKTPIKMSDATPEHTPVANEPDVQLGQSGVDEVENAVKRSPKLSTPSPKPARRVSKLDQNNDQIVDADTPKSALKPGAGSQRSSISSSRRSVKTPIKMSDATPEHTPVANEPDVQLGQSGVDEVENAVKRSPKLSTPSPKPARRVSKLDQNNDQIVDADTPKSALKPGAGSQRSSISSSQRSVKTPIKMSDATPEHTPVANEPDVQLGQSNVDEVENAVKRSPKLSTPFPKSARRVSKLDQNNDQIVDADTPKSASKAGAGSQRSSISSSQRSVKTPIKMSEATPEHTPVANEPDLQLGQSNVGEAENAVKRSPKLSTPTPKSARRVSKLDQNNDEIVDADTPKSALKPGAGSQRSSISSSRRSVKTPIKMSDATPEHTPVANEPDVQLGQSGADEVENAVKRSPKLSTPTPKSARRVSKLDQNNDQIVDADTPKSALKPGAGSQRSSILSSQRSVKTPIKMSEATPEHTPVANEPDVQLGQSNVGEAENAVKRSPKLSTPSPKPARRVSKITPGSSPRFIKKTPLKTGITKLRRSSVTLQEVDEATTPRISTDRGRKRKLTGDVPVPLGKRRSVTFGPHLSPEEFALHLPPNTPIRKGASPLHRSLHGDHHRCGFASVDRAQSIAEESPTVSPKLTSPKTLNDEAGAAANVDKTPVRRNSPSSSSRSATRRSLEKSPRQKPGDKTPVTGTRRTPRVGTGKKHVSPKCQTADRGVASVKKPKSPGLMKTPTMSSTPAKAVALRAIYGKEATPKLPTAYLKSLTKCPRQTPTPRSTPERSMQVTPRSASQSGTQKKSPSFSLSRVTPESVSPVKSFTEITPKHGSAKRSPKRTPKSTGMSGTPRHNSRKSTPKSTGKKGTPHVTPKGTPRPAVQRSTPKSASKKVTPRSGVKARRSMKATPISVGVKKTPRTRRTLTGSSSVKKPRTWADVVKRGIPSKSLASKKALLRGTLMVRAQKPTKVVRKSKSTRNIRLATGHAVPDSLSTGHAQSPATLVIKKKIAKTPKPLPKKGRKATIYQSSVGGAGDVSYDGLSDLLATPKNLTSNTSRFSLAGSPSPYSDLPPTPEGPGEMMVSPLSVGQETPILDGVRELVKTPKVQQTPRFDGVRDLLATPKEQKTPKLAGVRDLLKTPREQKTPRLAGVKKLVKTPKVQQTPRFDGVRDLLKTPREQKTPRLAGVKKLVKTPKVQQTPRFDGVRDLLKTPKEQKTPKLAGVRDLLKTPKEQKTPKLAGVRDLLKTPTEQQSPKLGGIRNLMKTPKMQATPKLDGISDLLKTPEDVLTASIREEIMTEEACDVKSPTVEAVSADQPHKDAPSPVRGTSSKSSRNRKTTGKKETRSSAVKGSRSSNRKKEMTDEETELSVNVKKEGMVKERYSMSPVNTVSSDSRNKTKIARRQEMQSSPDKAVRSRTLRNKKENAIVELKSTSPLDVTSSQNNRSRRGARKVAEEAVVGAVSSRSARNRREPAGAKQASSPVKVAPSQSSHKKVSTKGAKQSSPGKVAPTRSTRRRKEVTTEGGQSSPAGNKSKKPASGRSLKKKGADEKLELSSSPRKEHVEEVSPEQVSMTQSKKKRVKQSSPGKTAPNRSIDKRKEVVSEKIKPTPVRARSTRSSRNEKEEIREETPSPLKVAPRRGSKKSSQTTSSATNKKDEEIVDEKVAVSSLLKVSSSKRAQNKKDLGKALETSSPVRAYSKRGSRNKSDLKEADSTSFTSSRKTRQKKEAVSKEIKPASPAKVVASSKRTGNKVATRKSGRSSAADLSQDDAAGSSTMASRRTASKRKASQLDEGTVVESVKRPRATRSRAANGTPAKDNSRTAAIAEGKNVRSTRAKRTAAAVSKQTKTAKRVKTS